MLIFGYPVSVDEKVEGERAGKLPHSAFPDVVVYNKELFDAANIPHPKGDWTWEQLSDISRQLKPAGGPIFPYEPNSLNFLMAGTGKGIVSPKGDTVVGYLDSPVAVRTLQWLNAHYRDSEKTASTNLSELFANFNRGQLGMFITGPGFAFSNFRESNRDKLGIAPLPHFASGKRANILDLHGFGIYSKSKHAEAAWKFIEYLTLTKNEDSLKFAGDLTTSKAIAEANGQNKDPSKRVYVEEMKYAVISSTNNNPYFNEAWNEVLMAQFQRLLSVSDKDIPDELHKLALKVDEELNRLKIVNDQQVKTSTP